MLHQLCPTSAGVVDRRGTRGRGCWQMRVSCADCIHSLCISFEHVEDGTSSCTVHGLSRFQGCTVLFTT